MKETDLIIIGAGPGGYRAAEYAAKQGLKVTIFEGENVGGTCLNVGCIPTKTYVHATSFDEARQRMEQVVTQLRAGVETILSHPNITLVRSRAQFLEDHTVCTVGSDSVAAGETFTAEHIIIATGSETKWLPIEGRDDPRVVDSTGLLNRDTLPRRLCIIGAGVIGMEFASAFSRFGSEVTVIEYLKECLPAIDSDIAKRLRKVMEKRGITFHMQCAVKQIADGEVTFENRKGQTESVCADLVLMATGRKPRTDGLNLQAAGITLTPQGAIPVDDNFRVLGGGLKVEGGGRIDSALETDLLPPSTFNPPPNRAAANSSLFTLHSSLKKLYAIGDVNGRQMLAHAAEMQAVHAVNHILGKPDNIHFDIMPAAIFTHPEAACVGPSEDQLRAAATPYECRKALWRANGKALAMNQSEGLLKLFVAEEGRILGCHAFGAHAADIVQQVSNLMCCNATIAQLADMIHIHPTLSEILHDAVG